MLMCYVLLSVRTSSGASIGRGNDAVVAAIEDRLAEFTKAPVSHGEPLHVLRSVDMTCPDRS